MVSPRQPMARSSKDFCLAVLADTMPGRDELKGRAQQVLACPPVCFGSIRVDLHVRNMSGYGVISEVPIVRFDG